MSVEVRGLTVRVGEREIVSKVSFSLTAGKVTALVGQSGSGKTTTALALLGEWPAGATVTGRVEVDGSAVGPGHPPPRGTVGYLPQHPSAALNPVRRIGPVMREIARRHLPGEPRQVARERALDALRQAQLEDAEGYLRRYPHQLSGGQQQRVVLAHELIGQPRVLIADEPTTGQDAIIRAQLADELRAVARRGVAILLLSHDLDLVRALADDVLVMRRGVVVEAGRCEDVLGSPRHEYTRRLVDARSGAAAGTSAESGEQVLSVQRLVAGHGRADTLHDVSLELRSHDRLAVLGRSGCGKTTLARCIAGLHPFTEGEIRLGTTVLSPLLRRRTKEHLARVQYVFQDARASFNEFAPVLDQVARTAERLRGLSRGDAREKAIAELARLGITAEGADRMPGSLSGGELQRAALVRAVLAEPEVLICDEVTSGLDAITEAELLDVLRTLQENTACALMVITHDLAVVTRLARRVVVMDSGRIVEQGRTAELVASPEHPVTRALLTASNHRDSDLEEVSHG